MVQEIFRFNETLIDRFPIKLIGEIANDIAASSLDPELLGVLAALSSSHGAQPHVEIQLQVTKPPLPLGWLGSLTCSLARLRVHTSATWPYFRRRRRRPLHFTAHLFTS